MVTIRKPHFNCYPLMLVGYMRVSSDSDRQSTDLQRDALLAAGIDTRHLFEDRASGAKDDRPGGWPGFLDGQVEHFTRPKLNTFKG